MRFWFILCFTFVAATIHADEKLRDILTVSGQGKAKVIARLAEVRLAVEADGASAREVQEKLAELSAPVLEALQENRAEKVESTSMSIFPKYHKDSQEVTGYRGQMAISFAAPVDAAGELIDAAIHAGATTVQGISMRADEAQLAAARSEALKQAAQVALSEAKTVLDVLHLTQQSISRINVSSGGGFQTPRLYRALAMQSGGPTTELTEEEQEVTAEITLEISYSASGAVL